MTSTAAPARHAVIIGVCDYPLLGTADAAVGADLDAVAWCAIAGAVNYPVNEVSLLRAPPLPAGQQAVYLPVNSQGASRSEILAAVSALVNDLRANPGQRGLLVYAGHGALINGELHLCPSDTALDSAGQLTGTIGFDEIYALIGPEPLHERGEDRWDEAAGAPSGA